MCRVGRAKDKHELVGQMVGGRGRGVGGIMVRRYMAGLVWVGQALVRVWLLCASVNAGACARTVQGLMLGGVGKCVCAGGGTRMFACRQCKAGSWTGPGMLD